MTAKRRPTASAKHGLTAKSKAKAATRPRAANPDYATIAGRYAHIRIWEHHHQRKVPKGFIVHHGPDPDKRNNTVCKRPRPCPKLDCGNLSVMSRANHIREHRPGRMSGTYIPNKRPNKEHRCTSCGALKSKNGSLCRDCLWSLPK